MSSKLPKGKCFYLSINDPPWRIYILLYLCCRGVAKAIKKQKRGGSSEDPKSAEPEKQHTDISEAQTEDPEEPMDDPPPSVDAILPEKIDAELNPVASHDPPSAKPPTPQKPTEEIRLDKDPEDVTITGTAYSTLGASTVLAKHITKEESHSLDKGKAKLDLESYAAFIASDIHAGYLSRLHTSRDL